MIRRITTLGILLLLAGCAARAPAPAPSAAPNTVPLPKPPPSRAEPPAFTGLTADALRMRLGAPAFSRKDGGTEMWRYDARACHAFFFFTGGKISHVETIPRPNDQTADAACLNALRKAS
jgi:hypothetical protein